jgi:hypothetical protein
VQELKFRGICVLARTHASARDITHSPADQLLSVLVSYVVN